MVYFCLIVCLMGVNGKSTSWLWRFLLPFLSLTGTTAPELGVAYVRVCACMLLSRSIINAVCFCCLFRCHPILPRGCIFDDPGKARRALRFFSCITVDCGMNHHLTAIYPIWSPPDNIISMLSVFFIVVKDCTEQAVLLTQWSECLLGWCWGRFRLLHCHHVLVYIIYYIVRNMVNKVNWPNLNLLKPWNSNR